MTMQRWIRHRIRVRYQETDQMGVVYHANYLNWLEIGRTEMIRAMGMAYHEIEKRGLLLPVIEAQLQCVKPARYDDLIDIYTRVKSFSSVRISFENEIRKTLDDAVTQNINSIVTEQAEVPSGELLVSGSTHHVWLNDQWKPVRLDRYAGDIYELIKASFQ